jgi:hypothetical protein
MGELEGGREAPPSSMAGPIVRTQSSLARERKRTGGKECQSGERSRRQGCRIAESHAESSAEGRACHDSVTQAALWERNATLRSNRQASASRPLELPLESTDRSFSFLGVGCAMLTR